MSRSQQDQTFNTASQQNQTNEANSQKSQQAEQQDIANEQSQLAKFAAGNPYVQGGEYQTAQGQTIAGAANAASTAGKAAMQDQALRTGQNPAAANATASSLAQAAQREAATQQGEAEQQRIGEKSAYDQQSLSDQNAITGQQAQLAALQSGAAQGALGTQEQAAQQPSFMDMLGAGLIQGSDELAGGYGEALCPAKGSRFLMADGTELPVELLKVGDSLMGIDGEPQAILEIQPAVAPVLMVGTLSGHIARISESHAFVLPAGGFVEADRALGKAVLTDRGPSQVTKVFEDGDDAVYNVITDGSHTYRADGIWALGVGEMELRERRGSSEKLMATGV